jgi:hypothetical protein
MITEIDSKSDQQSSSVDPAYPFPRAVDKLSDLTFQCELAFPFVGIVPKRFIKDGIDENLWRYMGREKFKELVQELKKVRKSSSNTTLWLYGTQGYGKSHLLAALVCYLAAQDERVVYIPHCREWLRNPIQYIQAAMLFAWADNPTLQKEIIALSTSDDITRFFQSQEEVIFVVDQLNALTTNECSFAKAKMRVKLYEWLDLCTSGSRAVFSSSAKDSEFLKSSLKQNSYTVLGVYGGFTKAEMKQWWELNNDAIPDFEKKEVELFKNKVEDLTGCIPLLLNGCVVDGKIDLSAEALTNISKQVRSFMSRMERKENDKSWKMYPHSIKCPEISLTCTGIVNLSQLASTAGLWGLTWTSTSLIIGTSTT